MSENYHEPVLLKETIEGVFVNANGLYVDATFGGGGHARALLKKLTEDGSIIALDQDQQALKNQDPKDSRIRLFHQNFRYMEGLLKAYKFKEVSGVIADLGVSSHQIDTAQRGFSIRFDHDLDMRMNQNVKSSAYDIVNLYSEAKLAEIFLSYGELGGSRSIAKKIVEIRQINPIKTTFDLIKIFEKNIHPKQRRKFFARLFQAIRIEVNDEIQALKEFLTQTLRVLKPTGRIAVISYHSLEDRLVKRFFKSGNFQGQASEDFYGNKSFPLKPIHSKIIVPSQEEIHRNPRAKSARLRIAEKL